MSFAQAARDLNLTSTAVSHQVRSLEQHLGHALFERLARGLRLTEMGAAYLRTCGGRSRTSRPRRPSCSARAR